MNKTQKPLPQRRFQLQELIDNLYKFDYFTAFSDDYRVYSNGLVKESELKKTIEAFKLTEDEKHFILRVLGYRFDANYLESREFYDCVPENGLWNENNRIKPVIKNFLGLP
jgi:hypothetical protein